MVKILRFMLFLALMMGLIYISETNAQKPIDIFDISPDLELNSDQVDALAANAEFMQLLQLSDKALKENKIPEYQYLKFCLYQYCTGTFEIFGKCKDRNTGEIYYLPIPKEEEIKRSSSKPRTGDFFLGNVIRVFPGDMSYLKFVEFQVNQKVSR